MDFSDGQCAVQGSLRNAIPEQGSLETYLYSPGRVNLFAENIFHWFTRRDVVREIPYAPVSDQGVVSIFGPMVSDILCLQLPTARKEKI